MRSTTATPHGRTGFPLALLAILALAPELAAQAELPPAVSYVLTAETNGSPGGRWTVTQWSDITLARWPEDEGGGIAVVAGPAVGGLPAEPVDEFGGLLSVLFDPAADFGPGYRKESQYGSGNAAVDSLQLELTEGAGDERIAGHDARHHVLTARLWWRHVAEDGTETAVVDSGTADLWFAPDLPFSWLPLGVHPARPGLALPLSFWWPEVAAAAVVRYGPRFEDLGLPLRARTRDESRPDENPASQIQLMGSELQSSVLVSDVREVDEAPDPERESIVGLPRIARYRAEALKIVLFVLDPCQALASPAGGTFRFVASGPREHGSDGPGALFVTDTGMDDAYAVVTGGMREDDRECTLIMLPGDSPRTGTFPVMDPRPGGETGSETAVVLHVSGGQALERILVLDGGEVRIDAAGAAGVSGRVEGRGWALEPHDDRPAELIEGIEVVMEFEAVPSQASP